MTTGKDKDSNFDFIDEKYKKEQKCFDEVVVTGKDYRGNKATTTWPRDMPQSQLYYNEWLSKVKDPDTGKFYSQRDKDGNIIKGTGPKHVIKNIVRVRTSDDKEYLYSRGYILGFSVTGDPVRETCEAPETYQHTDFEYKREYDPKTGSVKSIPIGPTHAETIYDMPFSSDNVKKLYDKRITPETMKLLRQSRMGDNVTFVLKDIRNNTIRDVKDPTGIPSKTLELFSTKSFDYLYNSEYISPQLKAELRQQAVDLGVLPPVQVQGADNNQLTKPRSGTYS